jgi:Tfp pilus assembly protein PilN
MSEALMIIVAVVAPLVFYMEWRLTKLQESIDTLQESIDEAGTIIGEVAEMMKEQNLKQ